MARTQSKSKTAAKKATRGKRTPRFTPEQKITLLAKENPRRKGRTGKVFGYYKTEMTVGQFLAKPDALMVDLLADVERGHIKVG